MKNVLATIYDVFNGNWHRRIYTTCTLFFVLVILNLDIRSFPIYLAPFENPLLTLISIYFMLGMINWVVKDIVNKKYNKKCNEYIAQETAKGRNEEDVKAEIKVREDMNFWYDQWMYYSSTIPPIEYSSGNKLLDQQKWDTERSLHVKDCYNNYLDCKKELKFVYGKDE